MVTLALYEKLKEDRIQSQAYLFVQAFQNV